MRYGDYKSIPDLIEKYPEVPIIVEIRYYYNDIDWEQLSLFNKMSQNNIICSVSSYEQGEICKDLGLKFYCGFPIATYWDLHSWLDLGVCYVKLDAPLFFDLPTVVTQIGEAKVRAVANVAYDSSLPHKDGVCGTWIRPEDISTYEPYIETIEFEDCDNRKEQALYRVYAEKKEWPGELGQLITNFDFDGVNRMISPSLGEKRIKCRQRCTYGKCQACYIALRLANPILLKSYKEQLLESSDQN